ncbi:hypothetical protein PAXRUDRAFT_17106 [Paxillus rubicundulus Ve08.2h10]|uniref:Uncharacterized protein n=1 Tax=Paxillus rubicundulus Ve08.2h10 TaxID=930991 RepID=A0A0D0D3C4_9AGAM|nr:hypothetical protein PAXRUDRAFT_17106 [Paxillus rubicundulus Ve08.2h10]
MFPHHAATSGSNAAPAPRPSNIDPSLVSLPQGLDDDHIVPQVIASVQGYAPSSKVAGVHRLGKSSTTTSNKCTNKGKEKEKENIGVEKPKKCSQAIELDDNGEILPKAKWGCLQGANNYTAGDMTTLLDCVEDELPLGQ